MSNYTKSTDFASKDTLPSGDSAKIVRGTEIDAEFEAIETAVASKIDTTEIGSSVQAYDADLTTLAAGGAGARSFLGLAAIAASGSASDLSTGTVGTARLGSGTASSSTYLRGDQTWATVASNPGTVTSVATGNGLSGGTITSTGTLVIAAPSGNSVGSYSLAAYNSNGAFATNGSDYSAGSGFGQLQAQYVYGGAWITNPSGISGTWRWMSASTSNSGSGQYIGIVCRVA